MEKIYNTKYVVYRDAKFYDNAKMADLLRAATKELTGGEFDVLDPVNLDLLKMCKDHFKRKWYWTTKGIDQDIYIDFLNAYDGYIKAIKIVANVSTKVVGTEEYRAKVDRQMTLIERQNEINTAERNNYQMYKMPSQPDGGKE